MQFAFLERVRVPAYARGERTASAVGGLRGEVVDWVRDEDGTIDTGHYCIRFGGRTPAAFYDWVAAHDLRKD